MFGEIYAKCLIDCIGIAENLREIRFQKHYVGPLFVLLVVLFPDPSSKIVLPSHVIFFFPHSV